MSSESALSFSALFLGYLLKSAVAYFCLWVLSRYIRNPQVRFLLYALFLGGLVASWVWMFVSPYLPSFSATETSIGPVASARQFSWILNPSAVAAVARGVPGVLSAYVVILILLILRFYAHLWRVRKLVRSSQKAPDELSELFELVRLGIGAVPCELRFINDLRSPATTGWWKPKVLLPRELVPRLGRQQLTHIFQHELLHVSRRDYIWDRLSTIGCYVIFFHPLAWLARRCLRWEREFVCDESVVQGSREDRVEYASCLTTLASWWFLEEGVAGQVDFLSSPPSLLGARVRALLAQPIVYGAGKKTALILATTSALIVAMLLVPGISISSYRPSVLTLVRDEASLHSGQTVAGLQRAHAAKRRNRVASVRPTAAILSLSSAPTFNFPVQLPILSPSAIDQSYQSESASNETPSVSSASTESSNNSQSSGTIWDESRPQTVRRRGSKIGAVALRIVKVGIGLAATQIGDHEHEKEP